MKINLVGFMSLICGINTMNAMTDKFNTEETIKNMSKILNENLEELPHYDTINNVFKNIKEEEMRHIQKYIAYTLIRSKMFDLYRYKGFIRLIVDGTHLTTFDYKHCDHCLVENHKDGRITYKHYVLEAKICFSNIVISLDSEFVENIDHSVVEFHKQDCEINAFKRMSNRIKKNFPKLKFIISGDGLYANEPIIKICNQYKWNYIFTLKPDSLKTVNKDFDGIIKLDKGSKLKNYYFVCDYEYKSIKFNIVRFYDKKIDTTFAYITNINIDDNNIKQIILLGRARWKIENEGFNEQKNGTFNINHMCSLNYNAMKIHYFFIQFAHTIRQLFDKGRSFIREAKLKLKEVSSNILLELTSSPTDLSRDLTFQLRFDMLII